MIEARAVHLRRGDAWVLREVTLACRDREVIAVCGPNGAGKSSLLGLLAGEFPPTHGAVLLDRTALERFAPAQLAWRRAVLEQSPVLDAPFPVRTLVGFGLAAFPAVPPQAAGAIVETAMQQAGVDHLQDRAVTRLSGGERHRAHLARALAQAAGGRHLGHGRHLLLDEPTASLDLAHQIRVMHLLRRVAGEGTGVTVALHDLNLAAAFADRVVLMKAGRIVADGAPHAVLTASRLSDVYEAPLSVIAGPGRSLKIAPNLARPTCEAAGFGT